MIDVYYGEASKLIDNYQINYFALHTSIHNLFLTATLSLGDMGSIWSNTIKIGDKFDIRIKEGSISHQYIFRVQSCENRSSNESSIPTSIDINLIDEIYFLQTMRSNAYRGPISNIINTIVSSSSIIKQSNIKPSNDDAIIRYRIDELEGDFIEKITKLASHNQSPMFCFTDHQNILNFMSLDSMKTSPLIYTIKPLSIEEKFPSNSIEAFSYDVINNLTQAQTTTYKFTSKHIQHSDIAIQTAEISHDMNPHSIEKNIPQRTKQIFDWSTPFFDGVIISLREYILERMSGEYSIAVTKNTFNIPLKVGNVVNVHVLDHTNNLNDIFLITKLSFIYMPDGTFSRMELTRAIH